MRTFLAVELYLTGALFLTALVIGALKGFTIRRVWEIFRDGIPELLVSIWKCGAGDERMGK